MSGHPGEGPPGMGPVFWRRLAEGLMLAYLLTMPAGGLLPWWGRDPLLWGVVAAGVMDAAVGPARGRVRGLLPVGVFLGVHALTIATSSHVSLSLSLSSFMPVVAMLFIAWQRVLVTRGAHDRLYAALGAVAGVIALDAAAQAVLKFSVFTMSDAVPIDRVKASLPHPNDLVLVPILLPFAFEALRQRGRRWVIAGVVVLGPAVAVALLASKSRNAWLTAGGVALVWTWLVLGWRWAVAAMVALGGLAGGLYAADLFGARARASDFLRLHRDGRIGLWHTAWRMFIESPWIGKGVFTFGEYYNEPWFMLRVRLPEGYTPERGVIPWAHNLPLELLSERGVAGLGSFAWMLGSAVWSVRRRVREPRTAAALASLAGFLGASILDLTLMKDWVALMLFLLMAVLWTQDLAWPSLGDQHEPALLKPL